MTENLPLRRWFWIHHGSTTFKFSQVDKTSPKLVKVGNLWRPNLKEKNKKNTFSVLGSLKNKTDVKNSRLQKIASRVWNCTLQTCTWEFNPAIFEFWRLHIIYLSIPLKNNPWRVLAKSALPTVIHNNHMQLPTNCVNIWDRLGLPWSEFSNLERGYCHLQHLPCQSDIVVWHVFAFTHILWSKQTVLGLAPSCSNN